MSNENQEIRAVKRQKLADDYASIGDENKTIESDVSDEEFEIPDYMLASKDGARIGSQESPATEESNDNSTHYLETINRQILDFDFEKICSVTLANNNVYCCLVCGKYFQGRSKSSPAYVHSLQNNHHVYINLHTEKYYVLPENYEIISPKALKSLRDITNFLNPKYSKELVQKLPESAFDLNHDPYEVGYVGLNNISANDYSNVIIQALSHIEPIRNWYLRLSYDESLSERIARKSELNSKFGALVRKLWSSHLYRAHVSPHEFLQCLYSESKKQFPITTQVSPKKLLVWLLNNLHVQQAKASKKSQTVLSKAIRGQIRIKTVPIRTKEADSKVEFIPENESAKEVESNFWVLTLDLPSTPLFMDVSKIQEISILELLQKYNGVQTSQTSSSELKSYKLLSPLPEFLFLHIDRGLEKEGSTRGNPTVVQFPDTIDMAPYTEGAEGALNYKLISTIKHELITGSELDHSDDKNQWAISIRKKNDTWVCIKDLSSKPCDGGLLFLEENYIQIWQRC
ncbi:ubiquitin specific protease [Scheffersomyces xylosifermentans]|uniref:ubiquitin specific protease n=1 Tax=Scheffersomyces xylosifermentans TaxID=1304137 RepID=UPI00315C57F0